MGVYRNKKEDNFTVLDNNTLQDDNLSWKARGILVYLLSLPTDWEVKTGEIKRHASDGITSLRSGIKELKEAGYIVYRKYKNDEGKFVHEYEVYETPQSENPDLEKPSVDNPDMEKGDINKEYIEQRTNKQSNNNSCSDSKSQNDKVKFDKGSKPYKMAMYLKKKIKSNIPNQPVPKDSPKQMESWSLAMDRLHRLGTVGGDSGYSWDEIKEIIDWCQQDEFWYKNILSASKLRKQAVKLETRMKEDKGYTLNQPEEEIDYYADLREK